MNCPACGDTMTEKTIADLTVDVCEGGCGGIWFDNRELQKVDEAHEAAGEPLLDVAHDPQRSVDRSKRYMCPRCVDVVMMRHHASVKGEVTVDECPKCGGHFLDQGELRAIRAQYLDEAARRQAAREMFASLFDDELATHHQGSLTRVAQSKGLARVLRFLLPSYWLPGKQDWGAY